MEKLLKQSVSGKMRFKLEALYEGRSVSVELFFSFFRGFVMLATSPFLQGAQPDPARACWAGLGESSSGAAK